MSQEKSHLSFDAETRCFLIDGAPVELSATERERMNNINWWQSIPFAPDAIARGKYPVRENHGKYIVSIKSFEGLDVLGIGALEGYPLYLAEALGAKRVVGLTNSFGLEPDAAPGREFARKKLRSKVEFLEASIYDLTPRNFGMFDVVMIFNVIPHLKHPLLGIEKLTALSKAVVVVNSHVVVSDDPAPWVVMLPPNELPSVERNNSAPNRAWVEEAIKRQGFVLLHSNLMTFDELVMVAARDERQGKEPRPLKIEEMPLDDKNPEKTAVVVMSCELYSQAWRPFFTLFKKYWPDCPYKIYLGTDRGEYPGIETIALGEDRQWASNTQEVLNRIPEENVILFQEDFLLNAPVNTALVKKFVRHLKDQELGSIRLRALPGPSGAWKGAECLGTIGPFDDFRVSFQLTLWKKKVYLDLLSGGENPWTTEFLAARRATFMKEPFLSVKADEFAPIPYLAYAIDKGEWSEDSFKLLRKEGISLEGITKKVREHDKK